MLLEVEEEEVVEVVGVVFTTEQPGSSEQGGAVTLLREITAVGL